MRAEEIKKEVMKHYGRLKSDGSIEHKYPELQMEDGKKHVLIVQCLLERVSFYRSYVPYLILNDSATHTAIIASIEKRDFNKSFEDYEVFLPLDLIRWADVIVFPALLFDARKLFSSILDTNPDIRFMMDLNELHTSTVELANPNKLVEKINPALIENMRYSHIISSSSSKMMKLYKQEYDSNYERNQKRFVVLPTFLVSSYVEKKVESESNASLRIGLEQGCYNQATLDCISSLTEITNKTIELCVYGKQESKLNYPQNVNTSFTRQVKFLDYFRTINELKMDLMILIKCKKESEPSGAIFKYGELALLQIPLVCDKRYEAARFIKDGFNGFVLSKENTLKDQLTKILSDPSVTEGVGNTAKEMALKHLSWNARRVEQLTHIYE